MSDSQGSRKRWRTKEAREIADAVQKAGGTIARTGNGHLRISGPDGTAIVASAPETGRQGGRALANTLATIERETGLRVTPEPAKPRTATDGQEQPQEEPLSRQPRPARQGEVTRWTPASTYGFVTDDGGRSWFASRDSLPGDLDELPEGTRVTFSGSPNPKIGKAYPEALRICIDEPEPKISRDGEQQ